MRRPYPAIKASRERPLTPCPGCGDPMGYTGGCCWACWAEAGQGTREVSHLEHYTERQLHRLLAAGVPRAEREFLRRWAEVGA